MERPSIIVIIFILLVACFFRFTSLNVRPMHTDEAVHAYKLGALLEKGEYSYDPFEYHGPTLNYLTWCIAKATGCDLLVETSEFTHRIGPALCGVALIISVILLTGGLKPLTIALAMLLLAVSPVFVFYSRYYIHEMLLVCLSMILIGAVYRHIQHRSFFWVMTAGCSLGLMHATKETFVIAIFCMAVASVVVFMTMSTRHRWEVKHNLSIGDIALVALISIAVSVVCFSKCGTDFSAVIDSIRTYKTYFNRASGEAPHIHEWSWYFKCLFLNRHEGFPIWSEGVIGILALVGIGKSLNLGDTRGRTYLPLFLFVFSLVMMLIYCMISYKTPWCLLGFYMPIVLLAGLGLEVMLRSYNGIVLCFVSICVMGIVHLGFQAYQLNFIYFDQTENPWVYGHTDGDLLRLVDKVDSVAKIHPQHYAIKIQVIADDGDYWPLPWYLRHFTQIHWRTTVRDDVIDADLWVTTASTEKEMIDKLYTLPKPGKGRLIVPLLASPATLRHGKYISAYLPTDLYEQMQ